jgi:capsular polysaccharide biosynthesis protein
VLQAIRRHPILFVMPLVALTLLGAAVGYLRAPTYKATSQLVVGQLNVADPAAVGSVIQASQTTAAVYSRMINSAGVRKGIADKVHGKATGTDISATPIPGSPLIRVTAAAGSEGTAVTVANAAADALKKYASQYGTTSSDPSAIYSDYKAAALKVSRSQAKVGAIAAAFARDRSAANRRRLDVAQSNLQAAQLKRDTLKFDYSTSQQSVRFTPGIHTFTAAAAASSDRRSWMEILGLIGLVAGIALGAALATAALKRRMARLVAV